MWIKEYISNHSSKYFTAAQIRSAFNNKFKSELNISVSTIKRILKSKLRMKYKKLEKTNVKNLNPTSNRFMSE